MERKLMYVAAPYTADDPAIVRGRMDVFDDVVAALMRGDEYFPISPLHNHPIVANHKVPGDWNFWQHYSRRLLGRCDVIGIIQLPGHDTSPGVQGEIEFAESLSLPVVYLDWSREEYRRGVLSALAIEYGISYDNVSAIVGRAIPEVALARTRVEAYFPKHK